MAQITNAELKKQLDELSSWVKDRVEKVEQRMTTLEQQMLPTMKRVDDFFKFLKKFLTFMKWIGTIAGAALASQAAVWIFQHVIGK